MISLQSINRVLSDSWNIPQSAASPGVGEHRRRLSRRSLGTPIWLSAANHLLIERKADEDRANINFRYTCHITSIPSVASIYLQWSRDGPLQSARFPSQLEVAASWEAPARYSLRERQSESPERERVGPVGELLQRDGSLVAG